MAKKKILESLNQPAALFVMPNQKFDEVKIEVAGLEKAFDLFFNGPSKNKVEEADKASSGIKLGRGMLKFAKLLIKKIIIKITKKMRRNGAAHFCVILT